MLKIFLYIIPFIIVFIMGVGCMLSGTAARKLQIKTYFGAIALILISFVPLVNILIMCIGLYIIVENTKFGELHSRRK